MTWELSHKIGTALAGGFLWLATLLNPSIQTNQLLLGATPSSFNPVQAAPTTLSGAGIGTSDTSINLTSLKTRSGYAIQTADIGGIGFATIDQGTSKEENVSFTGVTQNGNGTAQLTGVIRGLSPISPYTASTTLAVAHSGGASVVLSNSAAFYNQFNIAANTSSITGAWNFVTVPTIPSSTNFTAANQVINKNYADGLAIAGAPNGSLTQKGIYQEATKAQIAAGTATGTTGADLVPPNYNFNATSSATTTVPVTNTNGTLDPNFINQSASANYNFLGSITSASTTLNGTTNIATSTFSGTATFNGPVNGISTNRLVYATTTAVDGRGTTATTTLATFTVASGTLGTNNMVKGDFNTTFSDTQGPIQYAFTLNYGSCTLAWNATSSAINTISTVQNPILFSFGLAANNSTTAQVLFIQPIQSAATTTASIGNGMWGTNFTYQQGTCSVDSTQSQILSFTAKQGSGSADANQGFIGKSTIVQVLR